MMDLDGRLDRLRVRLKESEADAALITKSSNVIYLTGLIGALDDIANAVCFVTQDDARFFTNFIYANVARRGLEGTPWEFNELGADFYASLCEDLSAASFDTLAVETSMPFGRFRFISEKCCGRVEAVDQWVESIRTVKENEEVVRIRASAALADQAFAHILEFVEVGRSEREIALELEFYMRSNGSDGVAFPPIVAGGPNAANPHAGVTDRVLTSGDVLKMDFGARVDGYCSDLTRTVVLGSPDDRLAQLHAAVLEANEAGRAAVRAGRRAADIDAEAREVLAGHGLADAFGHGLGHGVGLDVHEAPRLGTTSDDSVPAGAVVTVEPGVYVEGFAGVRIEDLVVVTDGGCELLSHAPRDLFEL